MPFITRKISGKSLLKDIKFNIKSLQSVLVYWWSIKTSILTRVISVWKINQLPDEGRLYLVNDAVFKTMESLSTG